MADNTTLNSGTGGDTIRTEDRTTFKTPVSLLDVGGVAGESIVGDAGVTMPVGGLAAENAAASGNPVLVGGRYDASSRTLGDGDVGAPALTVEGHTLAASAHRTDAMFNGVTTLTPKFAVIDAATSGDNTLVASVVGKKIRVLALMMISAGTVTARLEDGAAGTALTGQMNLKVNSGFTLPFCPVGWFETSSNTLLNLELSAAISVDGCLVYVEV